MYLSDIQDILTRLTDEELKIIEKDLCTIIEKRTREEESKALSEITSVIDKWAKHDIVFYLYDEDDHKRTIYPRELYVERGWL